MPENPLTKRVAVLGAGLTGLAAAHRVSELAKQRGQSVQVTVFEAGTRPGGLVGTVRIGNYLVDTGADSFLTNKPAAVGLCRRLGLEDQLVATDPKYRGALVLHDGRAVPIPEGFQLLSPTATWPIITTPLFSVWGKLRLLSEYFIPSKRKPIAKGASTAATGDLKDASFEEIDDESLSDFVLRRFGREALDRLIQPLVGGIYTSDPEQLSLAATMPRFLDMEREHGSLIRASLSQKSGNGKKGTREGANGSAYDTSSGARYGLFAGLKHGMQQFVDALVASLQSTCAIQFESRVVSITPIERSSGTAPLPSAASGYRLTFADGHSEEFDSVIVAVSANHTAGITESLNKQLSDELRQIEYASSAIVVSGHKLADIQNPLKAFGLVIPHKERRRILAVSFSSRKFPERAPEGRVLLRTFVGGALQPELYNVSDDDLLKLVREELAEVLGVHGEPDFMRICRYERSMPQYHVGHLDRVARIDKLTAQHPHFAIAGISCHGVGVPDAIASGERAAERILAGS